MTAPLGPLEGPPSLYECPACHRVVREVAGRSLICQCEALPLGSDHAYDAYFLAPFGVPGGRIGPPRPYYPDRERRMAERFDDGRRRVEDLRNAVWLT